MNISGYPKKKSLVTRRKNLYTANGHGKNNSRRNNLSSEFRDREYSHALKDYQLRRLLCASSHKALVNGEINTQDYELETPY